MQSFQIPNNSLEIYVFLIILDKFLLPSVREMNQCDDYNLLDCEREDLYSDENVRGDV